MNENINISFDIIQEFDKILWIVSELTIAQEKAINSLDLVRTGDLYEGKAKEEMISFYITSSNHIGSIINLYSKAYKYALNAMQRTMKHILNIVK